jgi:flagellar basal body rod protein FlgG
LPLFKNFFVKSFLLDILSLQQFKLGNLVEVLRLAAHGIEVDRARMTAISQNVANLKTAGYQRQVAMAPTFQMRVEAAGGVVPASIADSVQLAIDTTAGAFSPSASLQDVAVEDGYLELIAPSGEPAYTRQGSLRIDAEGRLVNQADLPLAGTQGVIHLPNRPFQVTSSGEIVQNGAVVAQLRLVRFQQAHGLEPAGHGMLRQGTARLDESGVAPRLRPGFQQESNVNSAHEMVRLSETVRHYEALHKLVQGYDDALDKALRKLGDF